MVALSCKMLNPGISVQSVILASIAASLILFIYHHQQFMSYHVLHWNFTFCKSIQRISPLQNRFLSEMCFGASGEFLHCREAEDAFVSLCVCVVTGGCSI